VAKNLESGKKGASEEVGRKPLSFVEMVSKPWGKGS